MYELDVFRVKITEEKQKAIYAELETEYGVNRYYLWNIINHADYEPPAWVCEKLGIAVYKPAPVCPRCNVVHLGRCKRTPAKQRKRYPIYTCWLWDWAIDEGMEV